MAKFLVTADYKSKGTAGVLKDAGIRICGPGVEVALKKNKN